MKIRDYMKLHFRHFNARETVAAAQGWVDLLDRGGKMFLTLAGAMSTAEIGISLAKMIRRKKVAAITCTGANLEEDVFNLLAHDEYFVVPNWRELSVADEEALYRRGMNRVTDTCIPETVMRHLDERLLAAWRAAEAEGVSKSPYRFMRDVLQDRSLHEHFQIPAEHSWVLAAHEMDIPVFVPGWEDSTLGNKFASHVITGRLKGHSVVQSGTEQMQELAAWYVAQAKAKTPVGFFQIGGGIAGDFPICVVPMLAQDVGDASTPCWAYFCQITDAQPSLGGYSGAVPGEKITWGKLDRASPRYCINSDASIVAPLVFSYVLDE